MAFVKHFDGYKCSNLFKKDAQFTSQKKVATCLLKLLTDTHLIFSYMS